MKKMNLSEIKLEEVFILDKDQVYEKNMILDRYSESLIIKSKMYPYNLRSVLNWFNFILCDGYSSLEEVSRDIAEDICILAKVDGEYKLVYINVAFPNRWRPTEKIDKNISQIHQPIPNFTETAKKIEKFLDIMDENVPYRRENWGFANSKELYLPFEKKDKTDEIYFRKERQTLIKINTFIIFLIKTDVKKSDKKKLESLSNNLSQEMKDYKLISSKL